MSLEELTLDSGELASNASEAPSEKSEKQKESSKKAQAQLQKTQKDEKKAKQDNDDLFILLSRFIQNPLYESLIPDVVLLLQNGYPSRFILTLMALVYPESAYMIFHKVEKNIDTTIYASLHHYKEQIVFSNDTLHPSLREWVTLWMSSSQLFLLQDESSVILQQKTLNLFETPLSHISHTAVSHFFSFFLASRNIIIEKKQADTYSDFILSEYQNTIKKFLQNADIDLKKAMTIEETDLFGI